MAEKERAKVLSASAEPVDPAQYSAPVVLTAAEIAVLAKLLTTAPLSGNQEQLVRVLAVIRSIQGKLTLAAQVIQKKLPKSKEKQV